MDLTNAAAIVTGGAGGFGSATVRRRARMGAKVVIAAVFDERGEALARAVGAGSLYHDMRPRLPSIIPSGPWGAPMRMGALME
jgi:NAD(P)-dependent dehydrogenase (short-subunit alcohol dehydrogenase family)